jgi:hypothetical protein
VAGPEASVFEEVAVMLPSLVPLELGPVRQQPRRWGIKAWFGGTADGKPARVHYEAQLLGAKHVPGAKVLAIEVGWHAEQSKEADNDALLAKVVAGEKAWRKVVGKEPVCGDFLGGATRWRRVSECWADPDLADPELAFELAARLTDYVIGLEPVLRTAAR